MSHVTRNAGKLWSFGSVLRVAGALPCKQCRYGNCAVLRRHIKNWHLLKQSSFRVLLWQLTAQNTTFVPSKYFWLNVPLRWLQTRSGQQGKGEVYNLSCDAWNNGEYLLPSVVACLVRSREYVSRYFPN